MKILKKLRGYITINFIIGLIIIIVCIVLVIKYPPVNQPSKLTLLETVKDVVESVDLDIEQHKKSRKRFNKNEERCRRIFENIFKVPFKSCRPDWLKNPKTGRNLELDGYNETIITPVGKGLAFEYDGKQHAEYTSYFHKSENDFEHQKRKDVYKTLLCQKHKIVLIRIPHTIQKEAFEDYIKKSLSLKGIKY